MGLASFHPIPGREEEGAGATMEASLPAGACHAEYQGGPGRVAATPRRGLPLQAAAWRLLWDWYSGQKA